MSLRMYKEYVQPPELKSCSSPSWDNRPLSHGRLVILNRFARQVSKLGAKNLFGGLSTASDFVDLVQNDFCTRPVAPLQAV